jgi:hypothetical protein
MQQSLKPDLTIVKGGKEKGKEGCASPYCCKGKAARLQRHGLVYKGEDQQHLEQHGACLGVGTCATTSDDLI